MTSRSIQQLYEGQSVAYHIKIYANITIFPQINIKNKSMIYGYIRVSSDRQTVENQRFEINNFCSRQSLCIDGWIEETISGTKNYTKRQLGKLLNRVQKDDLIICAELSRLGRNLFMIMEILNICMTKECRVWTIKDNYRLGEDIQSKVLAFAFGLSAEIERNLISQRTKEALARKKGEEAGTKLLLPMMIMLALVLVIIMYPAMGSMDMF